MPETSAAPAPAVPLLSARDLTVTYGARRGAFARGRRRLEPAVAGVSFDLFAGETLGLVGESGSGKSTTGRAILRLVEPVAGNVTFDGVELTALPRKALRRQRQAMQMIFQDPYSSLDGRMRVRDLIEEPLAIHGVGDDARREIVTEALLSVGLPVDALSRFPHEFSGGQRQRIAIARALILKPKLVVCDEPTSALDVSIQAQVLNLFMERQRELDLSYLFISHDIAVIKHVASRIAVMYGGRLVEIGPSESLLAEPLHPYTRTLLAAVPRVGRRANDTSRAPSTELPDVGNASEGCVFSSRCPFAQELCRREAPPNTAARPRHEVACHFWEDIAVSSTTSRRDERSPA
jgi:oligopeptide transport system ATP-binding protein